MNFQSAGGEMRRSGAASINDNEADGNPGKS